MTDEDMAQAEARRRADVIAMLRRLEDSACDCALGGLQEAARRQRKAMKWLHE